MSRALCAAAVRAGEIMEHVHTSRRRDRLFWWVGGGYILALTLLTLAGAAAVAAQAGAALTDPAVPRAVNWITTAGLLPLGLLPLLFLLPPLRRRLALAAARIGASVAIMLAVFCLICAVGAGLIAPTSVDDVAWDAVRHAMSWCAMLVTLSLSATVVTVVNRHKHGDEPLPLGWNPHPLTRADAREERELLRF